MVTVSKSFRIQSVWLRKEFYESDPYQSLLFRLTPQEFLSNFSPIEFAWFWDIFFFNLRFFKIRFKCKAAIAFKSNRNHSDWRRNDSEPFEMYSRIRRIHTEWPFYFDKCGIKNERSRNELTLSGGFRQNGHCVLINTESFRVNSEGHGINRKSQAIISCSRAYNHKS